MKLPILPHLPSRFFFLFISIWLLVPLGSQGQTKRVVADTLHPYQNFTLIEPEEDFNFGPLIIGFQPRISRVWPEGVFLDSLADLASKYNALVISPNGGKDRRVSSAEDYEFLTRAVKYIIKTYRVDPTRVFALGLNEGSDDAVQFVLAKPAVVSGAVLLDGTQSGLTHVFSNQKNAIGKKFLLLHYYKNFPRNRMQPLETILLKNEAEVKSLVVKPLTPRFRFTDIDQRFIDLFDWIFQEDYWGISEEKEWNAARNVFIYKVLIREIKPRGVLSLELTAGRPGAMQIRILSSTGKVYFDEVYYFVFGKRYVSIKVPGLPPGEYVLELNCPLGIVQESFKVVP